MHIIHVIIIISCETNKREKHLKCWDHEKLTNKTFIMHVHCEDRVGSSLEMISDYIFLHFNLKHFRNTNQYFMLW